MDADHDGFLTAAELEAAGQKCGVSLSQDKLQEVISNFDTRKDGSVEFEKICMAFHADS